MSVHVCLTCMSDFFERLKLHDSKETTPNEL